MFVSEDKEEYSVSQEGGRDEIGFEHLLVSVN
jgi:hypothetical protein